jgi:uncharacterized protein (DUF305 family)
MRRLTLAMSGAAGILLAAAAFAADHAGMDMSPNDPASTNAYKGAMMNMHHNMDITYTGDADIDFVNGMVPHHQGAVAMAKIELKYGKDPELRQMATDIIAAQDKEIAFMEAWRKKHPAGN